MRPVAVVAALILMAGCSQPSPTGNPMPAPHASTHVPAGAAPAASAGADVAIVPTIDYPTVVGLPSPRPSQAVPAAGNGGGGNSGGGGGSGNGGQSTPAPAQSQAPPAGAAFVSLKLDRMEQALAGDVVNLTAPDGDRLIFQYGLAPAAIDARQPGAAVRVSIRLPGVALRPFRQAEVESVLVTYMRVDERGGYHEWRGAFSKGGTASTVSFDGSAADGRLSFITRGLVISDGSGFGDDGSQMMIDWEMRDVPMALPPSPTPAPSDAGASTPSPSPSAWSW
jgi:hypothetical protein